MTLDRARQGRWAVAACFFLNGLVMGSWVPQIPLLVQRFDLNESALGLIILTVGVGAGMERRVRCRLRGRCRRRCLFRVSFIFCAFTLLYAAMAPSLLIVVVAVVFYGGSVGAIDVAMNANAVAVKRRLGTANMSSSHG